VSDLRARLLVANRQLYGEYDRLAAEAAFRINLFLPMTALGILIAVELNPLLGLPVFIAALILLVEGANRSGLSTAVLQRAVVTGVIQDQVGAKLKELTSAQARGIKSIPQPK
jgi:hypothetical protein